MAPLSLRIATLNIGGAKKTFDEFIHNSHQSRLQALELLINHLNADVLCLQEVTQYVDADGVTHSLMGRINAAGGYDHAFFGKTVSMETDLQVKKDIMVKGIFKDWWNWAMGNAIYSRVPFARLGDPTRNGIPRNIPLFRPIFYEGNRDTDPRSVLLTRLKQQPFPYLSSLHLTTLVGERPPNVIPHRDKKARQMREQQLSRFLDLVRANILDQRLPLILAGDFNAQADESTIEYLLKSAPGLIRLVPENDGPTHSEAEKAIDHLFFFPQERLVDYSCFIETSELSRRTSDHLSVVADLEIV